MKDVKDAINTKFNEQYGEGAEAVYSQYLKAAISDSFYRLYKPPKTFSIYPDLADIGNWKTIKTTMRSNNLIVND